MYKINDDLLSKIIGRSPLEISQAGLAAITNQLISAGEIHICGSQIVSGKSTIEPPLLVSLTTNPDTINSIAEYLSK